MNAIFLVHTLINRKAAALASKVDQQSITQAASFPGNVSSNRWYIARIFQIWLTPIGYEELAGGLI